MLSIFLTTPLNSDPRATGPTRRRGRSAAWLPAVGPGLVALLAAALLAGGCGPETDGSKSKDTPAISRQAEGGHPITRAYDTAGLRRERLEKDSFFLRNDSPIPAAARGSFTGLPYFPANPAMAFDVVLEKLPSPEPVSIAATKGDLRSMIRYGRMRFTVADRTCTLAVYKSDQYSDQLFIPFRDATNGRTTYEGGRYLDLQETPDRQHYTLDFNLAYNPYCAYNEEYTCPVVPKENVLPISIEAGETAAPHAGHNGEK